MESSLPFYLICMGFMLLKWGVLRGLWHKGGELDIGDGILVACLAVAGLIHGEDPARAYGLNLRGLARCPAGIMFMIWLSLFGCGRLVRGFVFKGTALQLVREGVISPAGGFQVLAGLPVKWLLISGIPYVACATLMEELLFRGILSDLASRAFGSGLVPLVVSAGLFGLVHFLPMWLVSRSRRGIPAFLVWYAFLMPGVAGAIFFLLNSACGSLWPGWILHWGQNYVSLVWNRLDGLWARTQSHLDGS